MIIDTHCHLDEFFYSHSSLQHLLESTHFSDHSQQFLAMSVSPDGWDLLLSLSKRFLCVHPSLGIHPWFVGKESQQSLPALESLLQSEKISAIGEIGLDYSVKHHHTKELQLDLLQAQLDLAAEYKKPVSLHVIKAHNEMLSILKSSSLSGAIHGLGSSLEIVRQYINLGFKVGVNAILLRDNARRYHEMVRYLGVEHIVLETDYPNITPEGLSAAQLSDIILIAERVAQLLDLPVDRVIDATARNANETFKLNGM